MNTYFCYDCAKDGITSQVPELTCPTCGSHRVHPSGDLHLHNLFDLDVYICPVVNPDGARYLLVKKPSGQVLVPLQEQDMFTVLPTEITPDESPPMYFMTVEWCSNGYRGIFCSHDGKPLRKDGEPHTHEEMDEALGPFALILGAKSEPFTEQQLAEYTSFYPLAEYRNRYGIALKPEQVEEKYNLPADEGAKQSNKDQEETP